MSVTQRQQRLLARILTVTNRGQTRHESEMLLAERFQVAELREAQRLVADSAMREMLGNAIHEAQLGT